MPNQPVARRHALRNRAKRVNRAPRYALKDMSMTKMGKRIRLIAFRAKADDDKKLLQELSSFVERALSHEHKRRTEEANNKLVSLTDDYDLEYWASCYAEELFEVERDFPRIQRYALFMASMSMMEAKKQA